MLYLSKRSISGPLLPLGLLPFPRLRHANLTATEVVHRGFEVFGGEGHSGITQGHQSQEGSVQASTIFGDWRQESRQLGDVARYAPSLIKTQLPWQQCVT